MTTSAQFAKDTKVILDQCHALLLTKGHDYTSQEDAFLNFRQSAAVAHVTPAQVALIQLGNKLSRLSQLIGNGKQAMNESQEDTLLDIINYCLLLGGILKENQAEVISNTSDH